MKVYVQVADPALQREIENNARIGIHEKRCAHGNLTCKGPVVVQSSGEWHYADGLIRRFYYCEAHKMSNDIPL